MSKTNVAKITRESFPKALWTIIEPEAFDSEAARGVISTKEYQIPENQRFPAWGKELQEGLIDTIMQNMPMSSIFMTPYIGKNGDGEAFQVSMIQDGQTRLSTAQQFSKDKFTWNGKLYSQFDEEERSQFKNYQVYVELVKPKKGVSSVEFEKICRIMFGRINSGKPLTNSDKYYNYREEPVIQLVYDLKKESEFSGKMKNLFGDVGGGKKRTKLADLVGVVLAIMREDSDNITPSYAENSPYIIGGLSKTVVVEVSEAKKEKVRAFFRWYFELVAEIIELDPKVKKNLKKIGGPFGLIISDWINGKAEARAEMWKHFVLKTKTNKYERKIYKLLGEGPSRNSSAKYFDLKIACIVAAYEKRMTAAAEGKEGGETESEYEDAADDDSEEECD